MSTQTNLQRSIVHQVLQEHAEKNRRRAELDALIAQEADHNRDALKKEWQERELEEVFRPQRYSTVSVHAEIRKHMIVGALVIISIIAAIVIGVASR